MNVPNILTVSRLFLTVAFIHYFSQSGEGPILTAVILFAIASWTDFYDGYYAKKHNLISNFGKIMDPIADKFLMLSAFYLFLDKHIIAWWMFIIILIREVSVTGSRLIAVKKGIVLAAEKAGKFKTVSQVVAIFVILIFVYCNEASLSASWSQNALSYWSTSINALMVLTVSLTLISGISYFWSNKLVLFKRGA